MCAANIYNTLAERQSEILSGSSSTLRDSAQLVSLQQVVFSFLLSMLGTDSGRQYKTELAEAAKKAASFHPVSDQIASIDLLEVGTLRLLGGMSADGFEGQLARIAAYFSGARQIIIRQCCGGKTTSLIELPLGRPQADEFQFKRRREEEPRAPAKSHVLVVDDEEVILDLMTDILTQMDHKVEKARNGAEALRKLASDRFDIIICDLKMPGMDGKTLYQKIRAQNPELIKKVIFSTGDTLSEDFRTFCSMTDCVVLEKPFMLEDLKKAIEVVELAQYQSG